MSSETPSPAAATEVHTLSFGAYGPPGTAEAAQAGARTQGYAAGYAAGMRAATDQARRQREEQRRRQQESARTAAAQVDAATSALAAAADAFQERVVPVVDTVETTLLEIGLELAEAIIGTELHDGPHSARTALTRALTGLDPADVRRVRMHPHSVAHLPADASQLAGVSITGDPQLQPGDAVTDLPEGFLDARISTALRRCRTALEAQRAQQMRREGTP